MHIGDYSGLAQLILDVVNVKTLSFSVGRGLAIRYDGTSWDVTLNGAAVTTPRLEALMPELVAKAWACLSETRACLQCGGPSPEESLCSKDCKRIYYTAKNAAKVKV